MDKEKKNKEDRIQERDERIILFNGVNIHQSEVDILEEIEVLTRLKFSTIYINDPERRYYPQMWFKVKEHDIIELNFSNCSFSTLPESIGELKSLQELNILRCNLLFLPESIKNLTSLQILFLGENKLTYLPESIVNLVSLKELTLEFNEFKSIPEAIFNLKSLQELNLHGNQLSNLSESIGNLSSIKELYLGDNQLKILPESIGNLTSLQVLSLCINKLTTLPKTIENLKSLKKLDLAKNNLTKIPEVIKSLTSLQLLGLYGNQIKILPDWIGDLNLLTHLTLTKNNLNSLPESIKNLKKLEDIDLDHALLDKKASVKTKKIVKALRKRGVVVRSDIFEDFTKRKLSTLGIIISFIPLIMILIGAPGFIIAMFYSDQGINIASFTEPLPQFLIISTYLFYIGVTITVIELFLICLLFKFLERS